MATPELRETSKHSNIQQSRLDDSWLECSICLEALTRNHKVLPCQHTFCMPCLEDVASSAKVKNILQAASEVEDVSSCDGKVKQDGFLCPECRAKVDIPLDKLPSNVILNRILEGREEGAAIISKAEPLSTGAVQISKNNISTSQKNTTNFCKNEKAPLTSSSQCDKYRAFAEAALVIQGQSNPKVSNTPKIENREKLPGIKHSKHSSNSTFSDINVPDVAPPPIPGNLTTNPFFQMVMSGSIPSSSCANVEKGDAKENLRKPTAIAGKEQKGTEEVLALSSQPLSNNNQNNQTNTAHYELLISKNNPRNIGLTSAPSLPPRTLSIVPSTASSKSCTSNLPSRQVPTSLASGTSSLSTSGAEDGSSPESPVPSLPPKPSFSFATVNSRNMDSRRKNSPEILRIKSANIPPPVQPPPPLPQLQKKVIQEQIEKELAAERNLKVPPTRRTSGGMPHQVYRALYDYTSNRNDELELHKNELYFVFEKCKDGWFKGSGLATLKTGVFPGNYVQHVHDESNIESQLCSSINSKDSLLKATSVQCPVKSNSKHMSSSSNDLIDFSKDISEESAENISTPDKRDGCKGATADRHSNVPPSEVPRVLCRASMTYPASSEYELDLNEGDIVMLIKTREDGWCKGILQKNGKTGLFPASFVQKM